MAEPERAADARASGADGKGTRVADGTELDPEVLRRAQKMEHAALVLFMKHYQGYVFALLSRRIYSRQRVEEFARDVAAPKLFLALPKYDPERGRLRAWIATVVLNALRDDGKAFRHREREIPLPGEGRGEELTSHGASPEQELIRREQAAALRSAIESIENEDVREVLLRTVYDGLTLEEIASDMGVPIGTIASRLDRAKRHVLGSFAEEKAKVG
jgi:RNA polymerase sigma factor (sigma-70 family)